MPETHRWAGRVKRSGRAWRASSGVASGTGSQRGRCCGFDLSVEELVLHLCTLAALLVRGDLIARLTGASKGAFHVDTTSMGTDPRGQALVHICG